MKEGYHNNQATIGKERESSCKTKAIDSGRIAFNQAFRFSYSCKIGFEVLHTANCFSSNIITLARVRSNKNVLDSNSRKTNMIKNNHAKSCHLEKYLKFYIIIIYRANEYLLWISIHCQDYCLKSEYLNKQPCHMIALNCSFIWLRETCSQHINEFQYVKKSMSHKKKEKISK